MSCSFCTHSRRPQSIVLNPLIQSAFDQNEPNKSQYLFLYQPFTAFSTSYSQEHLTLFLRNNQNNLFNRT